MKIILAPSKTQDFTTLRSAPLHQPHFDKKATKLAHKIKRLSKSKLSQIMSIKGDLLDATYQSYKNFDCASPAHAIDTYTGLVYKYMNVSDYTGDMLDYMEEHLCILSALYGALKPFDGIKPYRLDMKMPVLDESLYSFWKKDMVDYFQNEVIVDLASTEFSKMIPLPKTTVGFREYKDGKYKNLATYSKMARGMLLDLMIKKGIKSTEELKSLNFEGYHYNKDLSNESLIIFSRND